MNTFTEKLSPGFKFVELEKDKINYYTQKRFKDITSLVNRCKSDPKQACLPLLGCAYILTAALISQSIVTPILILGIFVISDYFDCASPYTKNPKNLSELFLKMEHQKNNPDLVKAETEKNDPRPIFLFLRAKSDYNGGLSLDQIRYSATISCCNYRNPGLKKLEEKYKIILIDNITSVDEIKEGLEKITNKIAYVWIFAHGNPTAMHLDDLDDDDNAIRNSNIDSLSTIMQEKLTDNAQVVLYSCSTGGVAARDNIATKFSKILPGRTIWAPKLDLYGANLDLGGDFSAKINMYGELNKSIMGHLNIFKEVIWGFCCLSSFHEINAKIRPNITGQFKDGKEYLGAT